LSEYYGISSGDIVLIITAGAVFWYSYETRQMRKEIVEQTKLQLAPFLTMDFEFRNICSLLIINRGEATARNIETECLPLPDGFGPFVKISTLAKDEKKYLKYESKDSNSVIGRSTLSDFRQETIFRIRYENIFGKRYESKVILKDSGLFFLNEFKVVS